MVTLPLQINLEYVPSVPLSTHLSMFCLSFCIYTHTPVCHLSLLSTHLSIFCLSNPHTCLLFIYPPVYTLTYVLSIPLPTHPSTSCRPLCISLYVQYLTLSAHLSIVFLLPHTHTLMPSLCFCPSTFCLYHSVHIPMLRLPFCLQIRPCSPVCLTGHKPAYACLFITTPDSNQSLILSFVFFLAIHISICPSLVTLFSPLSAYVFPSLLPFKS